MQVPAGLGMGEGGGDKRADRQADFASIRLQVDVVNRSSDTEEETMPLIIDFSIQEIEGGRRGELASLAGNDD